MIELRRRDFSDDCSTVSVERGVTHSGGKCYIATPKDSRPAKVAIPPHIRDAVIDHLSKHVGSEGDSLLFPALRSKCGHINDRVFSKEVLTPVTKSLALEGITHHSLRHFVGSRTGEVASLAETKERLRGSTQKPANVTSTPRRGSPTRVAERLSELALAELNGGRDE